MISDLGPGGPTLRIRPWTKIVVAGRHHRVERPQWRAKSGNDRFGEGAANIPSSGIAATLIPSLESSATRAGLCHTYERDAARPADLLSRDSLRLVAPEERAHLIDCPGLQLGRLAPGVDRRCGIRR